MLAISFEELVQRNLLCSPIQLKSKGNFINYFQLGADISFFLVTRAVKKKFHTLIEVVYLIKRKMKYDWRERKEETFLIVLASYVANDSYSSKLETKP